MIQERGTGMTESGNKGGMHGGDAPLPRVSINTDKINYTSSGAKEVSTENEQSLKGICASVIDGELGACV